MNLYYLQCEQLQFINSMLLGQIQICSFIGRCRNIFGQCSVA